MSAALVTIQHMITCFGVVALADAGPQLAARQQLHDDADALRLLVGAVAVRHVQ